MPLSLLLSLVILSVTLLSWLSQWFWPSWLLDLISSFQVQYAIANLFIWLWLLKRFRQGRTRARTAALLLGLVCISFQVVSLSDGYQSVRWRSIPQPASQLTFLSLNIHPGVEDYDPILDLIEQERPDFILLQEATALSLQELRRFTGRFPHSLNKIPPGDRQPGDKYPPTGTALFSRFPLTEIPLVPGSPAEQAGALAHVQTPFVDVPQSWLQIFVVHGQVPVLPSFYRQRNQQLAAAFETVQATELPAVVMGDFNTAPWSPQLAASKTQPLRSARQGLSLGPTWRPNLLLPKGLRWLSNLFWIPIDHCYVSPNIAANQFYLGPDVNSDHLPIVVKLKVPRSVADASQTWPRR